MFIFIEKIIIIIIIIVEGKTWLASNFLEFVRLIKNKIKIETFAAPMKGQFRNSSTNAMAKNNVVMWWRQHVRP